MLVFVFELGAYDVIFCYELENVVRTLYYEVLLRLCKHILSWLVCLASPGRVSEVIPGRGRHNVCMYACINCLAPLQFIFK